MSHIQTEYKLTHVEYESYSYGVRVTLIQGVFHTNTGFESYS